MTLPGRRLASRVGASMARAAGLGALVVHSLRAYEDLAVRLATGALAAWRPGHGHGHGHGHGDVDGDGAVPFSVLRALRGRLERGRAEGAPRRHALFDTAAWVRGFERGLLLLRELRHVGDCRRAAAEAAAAGNATLARRRPHRTFPEVAEMAMHVVVSAS